MYVELGDIPGGEREHQARDERGAKAADGAAGLLEREAVEEAA
jgi:hypothetical protein